MDSSKIGREGEGVLSVSFSMLVFDVLVSGFPDVEGLKNPLGMLLLSLDCQSVRYPGLDLTSATSRSPVSMATTRDMEGRSKGEA